MITIFTKMLSWVKQKLNKNGSKLFVEVTDESREKLNEACKLLQQLFPEDESATEQVMAVLKDIPQKDKKVFLYKVNYNIRTILEEAILVNNISVIRKLLETFPFDINNIKYNSKAPLHLACLYGRSEVVKLFLEAGASLSLVSDNISISPMKNNYATAKELGANSKHKGTPIWYIFVMDNVDVLQVLYEFDLFRHFTRETLLIEAITCKASKCTRFILNNTTVQQLKRQLASNSLVEASRRSLELVQVMLDAGAAYDENFFKANPNVLCQYYGGVGLSDSGLESTCTQFTELVMKEFNGMDHIKETIDGALVATLLERTRKKMRLLSKEEIETFYEDILSCLRLLVSLNPELPNEVPEAVDIALNCINHKYRFGPPNQAEISFLIKLVQSMIDIGFEPHGGFCCPLLLAVKIPKFLFCLDQSSRPHSSGDYLQLVQCFLESGCNPNREGSYGSPVLHQLINHLSAGSHNNTCTSPEFKNETFTKMLDLLCKYGLDPNVEIIYSSPANSNTDTVVKTTYLQLLVNKLSSVNYTRESGFTNARDCLCRISLFAGQHVNFSQEFQHGDFKAAVTVLARLFANGSCVSERRTTNYQRQSISPVSMAVSKVFAFLLSLMTIGQQQLALKWFDDECEMFFPDVALDVNTDPDNPRVTAEDMRNVLQEEGACGGSEPVSLQQDCALVVRRSLCIQSTNMKGSDCPLAKISCSDAATQLNVSKGRWFSAVTRLETNPLEDNTEMDGLGFQNEQEETADKLRKHGYHLCQYHYLTAVDLLPLPPALKDYVAVKQQLVDLLGEIFDVFEKQLNGNDN